MKINFLKYKNIYLVISLILILGSFVSLFVFGLKPGIDFTGGGILEVEYKTERPSNQQIRELLKDLPLGELVVQPTNEKGIILRMADISEEEHEQVILKLEEAGELEELHFDTIGPAIGKELKDKTKKVVVFSLIAIVLYIAFAFRKLSFPVRSWQYGIASLIILFFNVLLPLGVLSILGKYFGIQITIPVIVALLTIIGYTINNVIVVYDRLKENLLKSFHQKESFSEISNLAINQTFNRQINTSLTTLFPLTAIFFLGGETLKYFALTLILGLIFGLYSSIFLAIPLLVSWISWQKKI